jgi:4-amino-4-deoxy-L-arabinose transferase-like glycosyltransferase
MTDAAFDEPSRAAALARRSRAPCIIDGVAPHLDGRGDVLRPPVCAFAVPASDAPALTTARPTQGRAGAPVLLGALAAFIWLAGSIGLRPLTLPEEGRYVGVAWEMLRSGHWLVPTEDGLPFFHKPPLFYWLTAASMQLFGVNAAAARLAPLLGAMLGAVGLYLVSKRWAGERVAHWTVLVLVTMPFFFAGAQFANLDMLVAAFMALAILLAAQAALNLRVDRPHRAAVVGAWAAAALGVLAKGLIGVVLPGFVIVAWLLTTRQARTILALLWPVGPAVFLLIVAPWFVAVQMRYPGFAHFFFIYQHFERFAATGFNNPQPWWFFIATLPLLSLPWSFWLVRSTFKARAGEALEASLLRRLMWSWLVVVLVFFSIPQSKPIGYMMAVLFPLAYLAAEAVASRTHNGAGRAFRLAMTSVAAATLLCIATLAYFALAYEHDNTALARTLLRLRAPGDPVVFVGEYFFDIPLHARLAEPVAVISDWHDPAILTHDNWKRELAEAAPYAPAIAAAVLVDARQGFALRCGPAPLWVVARSDAESGVAALPGATRVDLSHRLALWRVGPGGCAPAEPARASP